MQKWGFSMTIHDYLKTEITRAGILLGESYCYHWCWFDAGCF